MIPCPPTRSLTVVALIALVAYSYVQGKLYREPQHDSVGNTIDRHLRTEQRLLQGLPGPKVVRHGGLVAVAPQVPSFIDPEHQQPHFQMPLIGDKSFPNCPVDILPDGTFLIQHRNLCKELVDDHNLGAACEELVKQKDRIKRIHYHFASCKAFDRMFGNKLGQLYGMKMVANALQKPFEFTCELAEGEHGNGAAFLMNMNSLSIIDPIMDASGQPLLAEDSCCGSSWCTWSCKSLNLASEIMASDWKHLTDPALVPIPGGHDDAVIHLRLGDALHSHYGNNEHRGLFPHGTYINLIEQAQQENGPITSIGIVTTPFEGNIRGLDVKSVPRSKVIAMDLVDALQNAFPQAKVRIHNGPKATIIEGQARLVHARKVAVCGCSTFCPYAVLATNGIGFVHNPLQSMNNWVVYAAERQENFRLFDAPVLNGILIHNKKTGEGLSDEDVLTWLRQQDPNVGTVDICERPLLRESSIGVEM